jgi:DNA-binding SARP family transcriptional activator
VHDLKELGKRGLSPRHEDAIEFRILGPLEASRLGQPLEVGAGKQRALLALLLLRAGEVVSTDRLIDALWGEHPPPSALNSIHVYVSQLRKVLGNGRLETRGRGYLLALEPAQLDLARFEHLLRDGRELLTSGEPDRAANTLRGALGLWRGSPLSDVASVPFAEGEVARLEELRLVALEERIEADLALGRHAELVPELEGLIRDHPLRERLRAQLMLALYRSGRQSEALAAYQQARKMLSTELGLEPGRTLRELEAGILRHDPTLDPPAQTPGLPRSARRKWPAVIAIAAALLLAAALAGFKLTGGDTPSPEVLPNSLVRIDPRTMKVADVVPIGDAPDLVVVAGGFVWVTHYVLRDTPDGGLRNAGDRTLTRVDPSTGGWRTALSEEAPTSCGSRRRRSASGLIPSRATRVSTAVSHTAAAPSGYQTFSADLLTAARTTRSRTSIQRRVWRSRFRLPGRRIPLLHGQGATATCG